MLLRGDAYAPGRSPIRCRATVGSVMRGIVAAPTTVRVAFVPLGLNDSSSRTVRVAKRTCAIPVVG